jgi:integrase
MLRLMAFHPMRPQEVAQLQGGDVLIEHGIKVLRVQAKDAITGNEHPQKSVKTAARLIPLHPAVADFYEHARKFGKDEFIFGKFKWNEGKGRAGWLMDKFPMFLRDKAKIREPTKRLVLYSLRHTFITAMRSAGVPEAEAKRLAGHGGDIHARYGGAELKLLADCIARTNPLELQA